MLQQPALSCSYTYYRVESVAQMSGAYQAEQRQRSRCETFTIAP